MAHTSLHLLDGFGIELEYMIVDETTLNVRPIADLLIQKVLGHIGGDVENDQVDWSNELVAHVIELKHHQPVQSLIHGDQPFHSEVIRINSILKSFQCKLLPTAMHPWMKPNKETTLWPHDNKAVYATFNRIFNCKGHGWSNLQSTHINLSFKGDKEFSKLHSATRFLLPLIPAMAASSPFYEGKRHDESHDQRLQFYLSNQKGIPSILGHAIPEDVHSISEYYETILLPMYKDIAPQDPEGELQYHWLNSRAAIPKFNEELTPQSVKASDIEGRLEWRIMDVQECPHADFALIDFFVTLLKSMVSDNSQKLIQENTIREDELLSVLKATIQHSQAAKIESKSFINFWSQFLVLNGGTPLSENCSIKDLLQHLYLRVCENQMHKASQFPIELILEKGSLSQRILKKTGSSPSHLQLFETYLNLANCLEKNTLLV